MYNIALFLTAAANGTEGPSPTDVASSLELSVWKYVVIIGVGAFVVLYIAKRIAEVVVKKKTDNLIERVVGNAADADEEASDSLEDLEKINKELSD